MGQIQRHTSMKEVPRTNAYKGNGDKCTPGLVAYLASPDAPSAKVSRQLNKHCFPPQGQHLMEVPSGSEPAKNGEEISEVLKLINYCCYF